LIWIKRPKTGGKMTDDAAVGSGMEASLKFSML
jgi:hypothetical protein